MKLNLKPYPQYKHSGLPWIGMLPAHWRTERAKWLFQRMQRPVRPEDEVVTCFRDGMVTLRRNRRVEGFTESLKEIGYQGVRLGDLVIHAMDAFAGAIGVSESDGKSTPVYAVCEPRRTLDVHYYAHAVREMARSQWIAALARGIRERSTDFRYETFSNEWLPFPPLAEQVSITSFLSSIDSKTRQLIRAKRRVIELLKEQKQATISRAVTRGLSHSARLKSAGIGGLDAVPVNWAVQPLTRCISELADYRGATPEKVNDGVFLVTAKNVRMGFIDYEVSKEFIRSEHYHRVMRRGLPRLGDVLLTMEAPLGNVALVDRADIALAQRVIRFRMNNDSFDSKFALYALMSPYFQRQLALRATGSTAQGLKASKIPQLLLVCPPVEEQRAIRSHLDQVLAGIDHAVKSAEREVNLVREYRTRLVADVVTGKLDVRGVDLAHLGAEVEPERLAEEEEEEDLEGEELVATNEGADAAN